MKPLPSRFKDVERVAKKCGFVFQRQKGSHRIYESNSRAIMVIPCHPGDIPPGTLRNIIAQMGLTVEQFNKLV